MIIFNTNSVAVTNLPETAATSISIRQSLIALAIPTLETVQMGPLWVLEYSQNIVSSTAQGEREQKIYKLALLKAYFKQSLSATIGKRLSEKNFIDELLKVALALSFYFPARELVLHENQREEGSHEFVVWIQGREDIEAEMEALDLFDEKWLILQTAKLRRGIIVLTE